MNRKMNDAWDRLSALRGASTSGGTGKRKLNKKLIVIGSVVLMVAIFSSVLMFGLVPGGSMRAMAGASSLTSISGENVIPDKYDPVNVGVGTYTMTDAQYKANTVGSSADGIAAFDFHIFADKFASTAHTCGNIAVNLLGAEVLGNTGAPEFGSRPNHDVDSTKLSYVGDTYGWASSTGISNENYQVFGPDVEITANGQVQIETKDGKKLLMGNDNNGSMTNNIYKENLAGSYVNINAELEEAENYMRWLVWLMEQEENDYTVSGPFNNIITRDNLVSAANMKTQNVKYLSYNDILYSGGPAGPGGMPGPGFGFGPGFGPGGTKIDFNKLLTKEEKESVDTIVIDLALSEVRDWMGNTTTVNEALQLIRGTVDIKGTAGKRIIFNIDATGVGDEFNFADTNMKADKLNNSEDSANKDNNILWNFYEKKNGVPVSYDGTITVGGTWMGTILAPNAKVYCRAGLNGSIIAKEVTTTAETHKSDYTGERVIDDDLDLKVTKIWEDDPSMRPPYITLQLLRDGKVIETVQVSTANIDKTNSTDYKWYYTFNDLPAADPQGNSYQYKVKELEVPGYTTQQVNNTIINTSTNTNVAPVVYSLTVNKVDASGAFLSGATLRLTSGNGANLSGATVSGAQDGSVKITDREITWISANGAVVIGNLSAGTYIVSEVTAPDGYKLAASASVTLDANTKPVTIENKPIEIKFNKINGESSYNAILPGAQFTLTPNWGDNLSNVEVLGANEVSKSANAITFTSANSTISFRGIAEGSYTLTENNAPAGYQKAAPITFIIDAAGNVTVNGAVDTDNTLEMINTLVPLNPATYNLTVTKTGENPDGENNISNLPDATLVLSAVDKNANFDNVTGGSVDKTNKTVTWTTGSSATVISNLPAGNYVLTETKAPAGYKVAAPVSISLTGGAENAIGVPHDATMHDELIKVTFEKLDGLSGGFVSGAKLSVAGTTADGQSYSANWDTANGPVILKGIPAGSYTLTEDKAPAGYTKAAPISFTVDVNGNVTYTENNQTVSGTKVTMYDQPSQIKIAKQYWKAKDDNDTSVDANETGLLGGATLKLTPAEGNNASLVNVSGSIPVTYSADENSISWTSSGSAANTLRGVPDGKYILSEIGTPAGYETANDVTINVSGNTITYAIESSNDGDKIDNNGVLLLTDKKEIYYPLSITKVDKDNNSLILPGATLAIFKDVEGGSIYKDGTTEIDREKAEIIFTSTETASQFVLPDGNYILAELEAPAGYDRTEELVHFTISTGGSVNIGQIEPGAGGNGNGNGSGNNNNNNTVALSTEKFTVGHLNGLSNYDYYDGRITVDITDNVKKYGNPTEITFNAQNSYVDGNLLQKGKIRIVVSDDGVTYDESKYYETDIYTGNSYSNIWSSLPTANYYALTIVLECESGAMTADQIAQLGISAAIKFNNNGSPHTQNVGGIVSGATALTSGEGADPGFVFGVPNEKIPTSGLVPDCNYVYSSYIDISAAVQSAGTFPNTAKVPVSIQGQQFKFNNRYAAIVKSDGTVIATAPYDNVSDQNGYTYTATFTYQTQATPENGATYYFMFLFNATDDMDATKFANSGVTGVSLTNGSGTSATTTTVGSYYDPATETPPVVTPPTTGTVTFTLKGTGDAKLSNVKFNVYIGTDANNISTHKGEMTTDSNGQITVSDVPAGSYIKFVQSSDVDGYNRVSEIISEGTVTAGETMTLTATATATAVPDAPLTPGDIEVTQPTNGEPVKIKFPNSKTPEQNLYNHSIKLEKVDQDGNKITGEATFELYNANGEAIKAVNNGNGNYVFDKDNSATNAVTEYKTVNGIITVTGLPAGEYSFYETEAPAGYIVGVYEDTNVPDGVFAGSEAATVFVDKSSPDAEVKVMDEAQRRTLTINKVDTNGNPLDGAFFKLYFAPVATKTVEGKTVSYVNYDGKYQVVNPTREDGLFTTDPTVPDNGGKIVVPNSVLQGMNGVFFVEEVTAPSGMIKAEGYWPKLTNSADVQNGVVTEGNVYFSDSNLYLYGVALGDGIPANLLMYTYEDSNSDGTPDDADNDGSIEVTGAQYVATTVNGTYEASIVVTNTPGTVKFEKLVAGTNEKLAGAVLKLTPANGGATQTSKPVPALSAVYATISGTETRVPVTDNYTINYNENGTVLGMKEEYLTWTSRAETVTLHGLPEGTYILSEVSAPDGYKKLVDAVTGEEITATVTVKADGTVEGDPVITLSNAPLTGSIRLTKVDAAYGDRIEGAQFKLKVKGSGEYVTVNGSDTFTTGEDGTVIIPNLAWGKTYVIEEYAAAAGYTATGATFSPSNEVEITKNNLSETIGVIVTNDRVDNGSIKLTKTDAVETDAVTGEKVKIDGAVFELHYRLAGTGLAFQKYGDKTYTTVNGEVSESGLPWGYEYKFVEVTAAPGYDPDSLRFTGAETATLTGNGETAEIFATNRKLVSFSVVKNWVGDSEIFAQDNIRKPVEIQLLESGQPVAGMTITLDAPNWSGEFTNLPAYDSEGNPADYSVREITVVPNYDYAGDPDYDAANNLFTVVNSLSAGYNPAEVTIELTKTWDDDNNRDAMRPESITVNLYANNAFVRAITLTKAEAVSTDNNVWKWQITGLAKNAGGAAINYTLKEVAVTNGYTASEVTGSMTDGFAVTNTRVPAKTSLTVNKIWDDENDQDDLRPDSVTVELYANGTKVEGSDKTLSESNNWTATWDNLYVYDGAQPTPGTIKYTVVEAQVTGYTATYTPVEYQADAAAGTINIKNTHIPGVTSVEVTKNWNDDNNRDGKRPTELTVNVIGKVDGVTCSTNELELTGTGNTWIGKLENLPAKNNGKTITYSVEESEVPDGYTSSVNGYVITNTHETAKINVSVSKIWDDDSDHDRVRPAAITVKLMNGETVVKSEVLDVANGVNGVTWEGLPKYENNGSVINYTIVEEVAADSVYDEPVYEKNVDETTGNISFEITNSYTPGKVDITVNKTWDHKGYTGTVPASVTVQLAIQLDEERVSLVDGTSVTLPNAQGAWTHTWSDQPEKLNGEPIVYTVVETPVAGYTAAVAPIDENGVISITNTRQTDGKLTINKIDADDETPIEGVKFKLQYKLPTAPDTAYAYYQVNGADWVGTTGEDGKIVLENLHWGYQYRIEEVEAAPGYGINSSIASGNGIFELNETTRAYLATVENARITTSAIFSKTDAATSQELPGATIVLENTDGTYLNSVTGFTGTNETPVDNIDDGKDNTFKWTSGTAAVALRNLPAGNYTMTEITAPYGYEIAEAITFVIGEDGKAYNTKGELISDINKITMKDAPVTATISKQQAGAGNEVEGAKLELKLEAAANAGTTLANVSGTIATTYNSTANSVTWYSGKTANVLSALPDGIYSLTETFVPEGYEQASAIYFKMEGGKVYNTNDYKGDATVWSEPGDKVVMVDEISTGSATISKQEVGGGDEIIGAELTVTLIAPEVSNATLSGVTGTVAGTTATDKTVSWISTDKANTLSELPDGTYSLTEVTAPDGYKVAETIYFKVNNGTVSNTTEYKGADTVWIEDAEKHVIMEDAPMSATISKVETGSGDEIVGAELTITLVEPANKGATLEKVTGTITVKYDDKTNSITWTSEEDANVLSRLPDGIYKLTEVTAPDGYKVAEEIYFKVDGEKVWNTTDYDGEDTDWDEVRDDTVIMEDAPVTATISKQAVGGGDELVGAELTVTLVEPAKKDATLEKVTGTVEVEYDKNTNSVTWVSEEDANVLSRLPDGIYTLTEVTAPAGYKVAETIYFMVEDGVVYNTDKYEEDDTDWDEADEETVIMLDAPVTATISKQAVGGGDELVGANLTVTLVTPEVRGTTLEKTTGTTKVTYDSKTNSVTWTSTDKANVLSVLPDGIYSLTEVFAPAGYEIAETMHFKIDNGVVYNTTEFKQAQTTWTEVQNGTIVMYDALTPADGTASFVKKSDLGKPLAGAVFTLKDSSGKTTNVTSNASGVVSFTGLDAGQYELTETSAPSGYTKSSQKVIVKVADDGTVAWFTTNNEGIPVSSVEVLFTNTYIIKPGTTTDKPVVGGTIDLSDDLDESLKDLDVKWESSDSTIAEVNQNGIVTIKKPGNFTITVTNNGKPVQNFVLGATQTNNNPTGTAPSTGNDLVQLSVTVSAVMLGGFALAAAGIYGYKRRKSSASGK